MRTLDIRTEYLGFRGEWVAVDLNTYDGAPDSTAKEYGVGETEQQAINDLLEQLEEADIMEA